MRILDLGCGSGRELSSWGASPQDPIIGIDLNHTRLAAARTIFPDRNFLQACGEVLPFKDVSFDRVISSVALPYMHIPRTLAEIHRVLVPGGTLMLSLHLPHFTVSELFRNALPSPAPTLYRLYVLANGCWFHATGKTVALGLGKTESFQTERGMKIALRRAGFTNPHFRRAPAWGSPVRGRIEQSPVDDTPVDKESRRDRPVVLLLCETHKSPALR